jgi:hypothetical protein
MSLFSDAYPAAYQTLYDAKPITCSVTGTTFDAAPTPCVVILDVGTSITVKILCLLLIVLPVLCFSSIASN